MTRTEQRATRTGRSESRRTNSPSLQPPEVTLERAPEPIVAISALEHHAYCPRQAALIYVDGVWFDNEHTVRGNAGHARVDAAPSRRERGVQVLRHIPLWSERLGLTGRADAVTVSGEGEVVPVEYKIGSPAGESAKLQLCAQALCLEEMFGRSVHFGAIWYSSTRHRTRVPIDPALRERTLDALTAIRAWMLAPTLPPAPYDGRCRSCQFLDYCQPELTSSPDRAALYVAQHVRCVS